MPVDYSPVRFQYLLRYDPELYQVEKVRFFLQAAIQMIQITNRRERNILDMESC